MVPPTSLAMIRKRLGSASLDVVPLQNSGHVATLDVDAPEIFEAFDAVLPGARAAATYRRRSHEHQLPDHSPFSSAFSGEGPRIGVALSHGFTGSPHGVRAWATVAGRRRLRRPDAAASGPRHQLAGAGPHAAGQDWHDAMDAAYLELEAECDHVFSAGLSMGGALALRIAATRPVAGTVLVNPGLVIDDPRAPLAGILKLVLKSTPAIANDILKPDMDEGAYPGHRWRPRTS